MGAFSGLKILFKKTLLAIILLLFIFAWFLALLAANLDPNSPFVFFISLFSGFLAGFIFILLIFSIFTPIEKMGAIIIIIALILTIPIFIIFYGIVMFFYVFCFFANLFLIALFAYKWSMDNSIKFDNILYKKKSSRKITRTLEFFTFLIITFLILSGTISYFRDILAINITANIFLIIAAIDLVLLLFVFLRLLLVQKFSAYISLFFLLTYIYILYVVIDFWSGLIFGAGGSPNIVYKVISFAIDLIMFLYIIGSIFDKIDYLKEKLHIFRVDTVALFVMLIKILVKIVEIGIQQNPINLPGFELFQTITVLIYFTFFALIFGLYSIIFHKEGKK